MSFYSLSSYSQLRVNQSAIGGTPTPPPFSNLHSFSFDGVDDYFFVPDTSGLSFGNGTTDSPFSISTWVKMTDATRFYVLSKGLVFSTNYEYLLNTNASDKIGLYLYDSSNNSRIGRFYNTPLTSYENQWIHICSTYNGSGLSSGIKVYLNGVRIDDTNSNSGTYVAMENGNRSLNIGRTETGLYSNGLIDETAIFTTELSQSDVSAIYNNGEPQSLDAYSPFVWFRLGDNATWNGATWTMTSVGTDTRIARSINMVEANRTTDVPPNPFENLQSILLDGVDDYVDCGTNLALLGSATTFSAWVKMTDATSFRVLHKGIAGSREYAFGMGTSDTLFLILYNGSTNYIGKVSTSTMTSYQGQWIHICATYDGSTNASGITLYVNGSVFNSNSISGGSYTAPSGNNNGDVYIGRYNTEYADGNIDEVSVFNAELSQSNVTSIYGGGVPSSLSSYSSLVSWWRCGDGDTAPILSDNGSGGNNGTMTNFSAFSSDVPTFSKKSIALDGVDDYVNVADNNNLSFGNGVADSPFSISAWIKPLDNARFRIAFKWGATSREYYFQTAGGGALQVKLNSSLSVYIGRNGQATISEDVWSHVVFTYDGSGNKNNINVYLNGVLDNGTTISSGTYTAMSNTTESFIIGGYNDGSNANGLIDETAIFTTELSASDVTSIYNGGVPNDISSLSPLSWWRCGDGDTAPILTDNAGSNDGTMTNFTTFSTDVPT